MPWMSVIVEKIAKNLQPHPKVAEYFRFLRPLEYLLSLVLTFSRDYSVVSTRMATVNARKKGHKMLGADVDDLLTMCLNPNNATPGLIIR
jgi:hypothetical protein